MTTCMGLIMFSFEIFICMINSYLLRVSYQGNSSVESPRVPSSTRRSQGDPKVRIMPNAPDGGDDLPPAFHGESMTATVHSDWEEKRWCEGLFSGQRRREAACAAAALLGTASLFGAALAGGGKTTISPTMKECAWRPSQLLDFSKAKGPGPRVVVATATSEARLPVVAAKAKWYQAQGSPFVVISNTSTCPCGIVCAPHIEDTPEWMEPYCERYSLGPVLADRLLSELEYDWMWFGDDDAIVNVENLRLKLHNFALDHTIPYHISDDAAGECHEPKENKDGEDDYTRAARCMLTAPPQGTNLTCAPPVAINRQCRWSEVLTYLQQPCWGEHHLNTRAAGIPWGAFGQVISRGAVRALVDAFEKRVNDTTGKDPRTLLDCSRRKQVDRIVTENLQRDADLGVSTFANDHASCTFGRHGKYKNWLPANNLQAAGVLGNIVVEEISVHGMEFDRQQMDRYQAVGKLIEFASEMLFSWS